MNFSKVWYSFDCRAVATNFDRINFGHSPGYGTTSWDINQKICLCRGSSCARTWPVTNCTSSPGHSRQATDDICVELMEGLVLLLSRCILNPFSLWSATISWSHLSTICCWIFLLASEVCELGNLLSIEL